MNKVCLVGRLTKDPTCEYVNTSNGSVARARFTIAVDRSFSSGNQDGNRTADFISVVAWEQLAETIHKYVKKGHKICAEGRIQTGSYDKEDGSKGYLTDVIMNHLEFLEKKSNDDRPAPEYTEAPTEEAEDPFKDFGDTVQLTDDDLPF